MFSRCISLEYKQQGIDIQCQVLILPHFIPVLLLCFLFDNLLEIDKNGCWISLTYAPTA